MRRVSRIRAGPVEFTEKSCQKRVKQKQAHNRRPAQPAVGRESLRAQRALRLLLLVVGLAAGCTPKIIPAPVVSAPKFPDVVAPIVPPSLAGSPAAESYDRGWQFFQAGDLKNAEREFSTVLKVVP